VTARILIVEDEALVAMELGLLMEDMGHEVAGYAADSFAALSHAALGGVDLALIDMHLADGPTGAEVGRRLADQGVNVLYVTSNPTMIDRGPARVIGVLCKPADEAVIENAVAYALACREGRAMSPPVDLRLLN